MKSEGLTVKELIKELQKLPQDSKIHVNKWFRRKGGLIEWGCYSVKAIGIVEGIDMDTNKKIYSIESERKSIEAVLSDYMEEMTCE